MEWMDLKEKTVDFLFFPETTNTLMNWGIIASVDFLFFPEKK